MSYSGLFSSERNGPTLSTVLSTLRSLIGHDRWFISGSYAHSEVKRPSDIDVFFYYEEDQESACKKLSNTIRGSNHSPIHVTKEASTFFSSILEKQIQLISKNYGTPEVIFDTFDLNVCKRAIYPNGTRTTHISAHKSLCIAKLNARTFERYFKYIKYLRIVDETRTRGKMLIDTYMHDSTIVKGFYNGKDISIAINKSLLKEVSKFRELRDYALEQAIVHAPELLI